MKKSLLISVFVLLATCVTFSGCATSTTCRASTSASSAVKSAVTVSKSDIAANAALYHKYFDLSSEQKGELTARGYSKAQISKLDKDDFIKLESTWKLSVSLIKDIKESTPALKDADLSAWTNADYEAYYTKQNDITYAPTANQAQQLKNRGIPLKLARRMLKEYCNYDNLLSQSDSKLAAMMKLYIESDQAYISFEKEKESIRAQYFKNLSSK